MHVLINHDGKTNAEIIGANMHVVQFKTQQIMERIERKEFKKVSEVFVAILHDSKLNDAEKLVTFHTVNKIMENSVIIIQFPGGGI